MVALFDASASDSVLTAAANRPDEKDRAIDITGLRFSWNVSSAPVLDIADLQIDKVQRVFIEGPSGSDKSTLLSLPSDWRFTNWC
jgi:ABC-type transport system involved in cytochrome bd biosynthesis fused ATPase/permease subunit